MMQTFLPYPTFSLSARCLDAKRLGKQRVETWQIYQALTDPSYGWQHHPAVKMWRGHEAALCNYGLYICLEWRLRGFKDTLMVRFQATPLGAPVPPWFGDEAFHASHRSNLLRKDPEHYGRFGWTEPSDLPYVWPQPKEST